MLSKLARAGAAGSQQRSPWRSAMSMLAHALDGAALCRPCPAEQAQVQPSLGVCSTAWLSTSTDLPSTDADTAGCAPDASIPHAENNCAGTLKIADDRLAILFTCGQCQARSMRSFSRRAYRDGVVIVQCPGCNVRHLVADRLGWFGEPGSVEDFLRQRGQDVQWNAADGSLEMTIEDAQAWAQMSQEQKAKAATAEGGSDVDTTRPDKQR